MTERAEAAARTPTLIAAWTPTGVSPPFVSIRDYSGHVVELIVRSRPSAGEEYGQTVSVELSHLQFDSVVEQILRWRKGETDNETDAPVATVAALRKALVKMEWSATTRHPLADGHCPTCPVCKAVQISEEHGHKADCALDAALALSTPTGKE